jgi:hypothetical protein
MDTYVVPVTIAEERRMTVRGYSPEHALERLKAGRYEKAGRPSLRGFLLYGTPERQEAPRA